MAVDTPAPIPEVPPVEKLLQRLVTETQSRPLLVVSPPASMGLEQILRSFLSGQQPTGLERSSLFLMWEIGSCCDSVPELG